MQRLELRHKSRRNPTSLVLEPYRRDVTSQNGEDGIIERIFEIIGPANRWCVEFGAWDGKLYSNTWNLIVNRGWTGLLIEGSRERFVDLQRTYAECAGRTHLVNRFVTLDPGARLDDLMTEAGAPQDCDLVSIDIDGNDWHIWNSVERFQPRVVVIECNPSIENDIYFVQDYGPSINHASSMLAMIELGKSKGYELVASTGANGFFVRRELFPAFGIADNSIDALHDGSDHVIKIFQGFDGTIFAVGDLKLHWHGINLTQEDFQVLRPIDRRFPGTPRRRWWRKLRE
jgi:hypothetical protein